MTPKQIKQRESNNAQDRIVEAIFELLHNPETPGGLFNRVADFVCEQPNRAGDELWHSDYVLREIVKSAAQEETRDAVLTERERDRDCNTPVN